MQHCVCGRALQMLFLAFAQVPVTNYSWMADRPPPSSDVDLLPASLFLVSIPLLYHHLARAQLRRGPGGIFSEHGSHFRTLRVYVLRTVQAQAIVSRTAHRCVLRGRSRNPIFRLLGWPSQLHLSPTLDPR